MIPDIGRCSAAGRADILGKDGYISSEITTQTRCASPKVPLVMNALQGQTINLWLLDFGALSRRSSKLHLACQQTLGYIIERNLGSNVTICGDSEREKPIYSSKTNNLELVLIARSNVDNNPRYLIRYSGVYVVFNNLIIILYIYLSTYTHIQK